MPKRLILIATVIVVPACGLSDAPEGTLAENTTWNGEVESEGRVTTVRNLDGSVWGGAAKLTEDLSIGVDRGPEAYLVGFVAGISVTADRIYVLDSQVPIVRVFDPDGIHLMDIGAEGRGPGEFRQPTSIAVNSNGHLFVRDLSRLTVFDDNGEVV